MNRLIANFAESIQIKSLIVENSSYTKHLQDIADCLSRSLHQHGKIVFCGNGGSCADAQHLAAELLVRLKSAHNRRPLASMALAQDTSTITACANDFDFNTLYSRLVEALVKPEDVLVAISTSGNSANIVAALEQAKQIGAHTVGLLGNGGGLAKSCCDLSFIVPSKITARIQEAHITAGHAIIEEVEWQLFPELSNT